MKKLIFLSALVIIFGACKKDGGSGKQLYLSKVFVDNLLSDQYTYSKENKVIRRDVYGTGLGQSTFNGFRLYEYEDDNISKVLYFNKNNLMLDRRGITYDASGNVTRVDQYGNDDEIDYYQIFTYTNGDVTKMVGWHTNPTKKATEWQLAYDDQHRLISFKRYSIPVAALVLFDSVHLVPSDKALPAHWKLYEESLVDFPADNNLMKMANASWYFYMPGGPPTSSENTFSEKQYNGQGYLTSQHYHVVGNAGLGPVSADYNLKYEYIE